MDSDTAEFAVIARPLPRRVGAPLGCPLENPATDVRIDDPLLEPRADEPGVGKNGDCHPLENPA